MAGEITDYQDIFKICRLLNVPFSDKEQLFRRMVFNYLAGDCDDHDKNFSFLMGPNGKWRLSPAYDETFTVNLHNPFKADRHAMSLAGQNKDISKALLLKAAQENDIKQAAAILEEVSEAVMSFPIVIQETSVESAVTETVFSYIRSRRDSLSKG